MWSKNFDKYENFFRKSAISQLLLGLQTYVWYQNAQNKKIRKNVLYKGYYGVYQKKSYHQINGFSIGRKGVIEYKYNIFKSVISQLLLGF